MTTAIIDLATGRTRPILHTTGWVLFGLGLVLLAGQLVKPVDPQDEGQLLTYPWLIAHGWMPYRDIWMSYPPGIYVLLAALFKVGLPGLAAERAIGVVALVGTILVVNRAMTDSLSRLSWLGVPATFSLLFSSSDVRAYPWLVALPLFILGLTLLQKRSYSAAALFFAAGTLRFEFALAGLLALLVVTALGVPGLSRRRLAGASAVLVAALVLFYAIFSLMTGGAAFKDIFLDQILPVEAARRLPLWPPQFGPLGMPIALVMLAAPPALVLAGILARRPFHIATNLAVLSLLPHFFQRADASHLFSTSAVVVPWALISLVDLQRARGADQSARSHGSVRAGRRAAAIGLGAVGLLAGAWCSLIVAGYAVYISPLSPLSSQRVGDFWSFRVSSGTHTVIAWNASEARDDRRIIDYLRREARPSDSVFIEPLSLASTYTMTDLYYPLALRPAAKYLEMQGGIETQTSVQREIARELDGCTWVVVLHGGRWYWGPAGSSSVRQGGMYERYIAAHFHMVYSTPTYLILRRNIGVR